MIELTWSAAYMLMGMLFFYGGGHSELGNLSLLNMTDFEDIYCLSANAYHGARGEGKNEQIAVTQVVMNRVLSPLHPPDICDVIMEPIAAKQFNWYWDGKTDEIRDLHAWQEVVKNVLTAYKPYKDFAATYDGAATWTQLNRLGISQDIIVRDLVHGATYYYPHKKMRKPDWANSMVVTTILSGHTYLKQF